jgi:hypothetical protein
VGCRRSAAQGAVTGAQKARFHIPLAKGANHEIILAATVAGTVIIFSLGYLIYGVLLVSFMQDNLIQYPV